ncbi:cytochrome P450 [Xylariaceae sp. FL0255]|nr:cytochrome P450 [Xylariaceae sp. FL0255]
MSISDITLTFVKCISLIVFPVSVFIAGYRLYLHPLRAYPGPLLARVSDIYTGFYALTRRLHLITYDDLNKYGPVLRHGPNTHIQFTEGPARVTKSHIYELTISSGKPTSRSKIDPRPVDMTNLTKRLGADIVGHLAFGYALNMQTDPKYRFVLQGLAVGQYQNNSFMQFPMLKKLDLHNLTLILGYSARVRYKAMMQTMINSRLAQEKHAKNDLYSFVVDHLDQDGKDSVKTSGDTTTTAMSALFFYLAHYRDVYNKLAMEIRQKFDDEPEIRNGPQLASCRYLRACIDEALRISPPVGGTLWRELSSDELGLDTGPLIVDGHVIPPGIQVGVSTYALHHNDEYFDDPFIFCPERWLTENRDALDRMSSAFNPFSSGARGCAGKAMAYLEASLVIAKTIWRFDFMLAPGKGQVGVVSERGRRTDSPVQFQLFDTFGSQHVGPNLVFHQRSL